jgi:hypothetical protein
MNAIGAVGLAVSLVAGMCAVGCIPFAIWLLLRRTPRLGLRVLQTFFAFSGFVILGMLAAIVAITIGHVPYNTP